MYSSEIRSIIIRALRPFSLDGRGLTQKRIIDTSDFLNTDAQEIAVEIESMCNEGIITKTYTGTAFYYKLTQ